MFINAELMKSDRQPLINKIYILITILQNVVSEQILINYIIQKKHTYVFELENRDTLLFALKLIYLKIDIKENIKIATNQHGLKICKDFLFKILTI